MRCNMDVLCEAKPHGGLTMVASRFNGWDAIRRVVIAPRRGATIEPDGCRVPTARNLSDTFLPAIEMAGYNCPMPDGITLFHA